MNKNIEIRTEEAIEDDRLDAQFEETQHKTLEIEQMESLYNLAKSN